MKIKTSELTGLALDWAVASLHGYTLTSDGISKLLQRGKEIRLLGSGSASLSDSPSTNWAQGGPIIERELLQVTPRFHSAGYTYPKGQWYWAAYVLGPSNMDENYEQHGPTPLIAAMRCFVASKLGDEVGVPEELL
jgi:hypothetical protein